MCASIISGASAKLSVTGNCQEGAVMEPSCHHVKFLCWSILLTQEDFHKLGIGGMRQHTSSHTSKKSGLGFPRPDPIRRATYTRPRCHPILYCHGSRRCQRKQWPALSWVAAAT